ncbi:MAG: hypothetical protein COV35_05015 [Alphaproteobacteria bacterium CG11_big_fil_rev_8_21_14_0_20_39_49]|nr:MAG: hypothetical protein COV35_05015 [Alphaproteobacteria bacterium CG11_big_fil_rev_8_21_14_0_20_39_49]
MSDLNRLGGENKSKESLSSDREDKNKETASGLRELSSAEKELIANLKAAPPGKQGMEVIANFVAGDIKMDGKRLSEALAGSSLVADFKDVRELEPSALQQKITRKAEELQQENKISETDAGTVKQKAESLKKPEVAEAVKEFAERSKQPSKENTPAKAPGSFTSSFLKEEEEADIRQDKGIGR